MLPAFQWRNFASAAASASQHRASNISAGRRSDIKVSRLANGMSVASVEGGGPVSRLGLAFRAGSRYEAADQRALAHRLRNCVGLGSANMSQTQILHQVAFVGAALQATLTKDLLFSEIDVLRDYVETGLQVVAETGSQTSFPRWVVADTDLHLDMDVHDYLHDHPRRLLDMAHRAAYRTGGLANELIGVFDGQPGHFTAAELSRFAVGAP